MMKKTAENTALKIITFILALVLAITAPISNVRAEEASQAQGQAVTTSVEPEEEEAEDIETSEIEAVETESIEASGNEPVQIGNTVGSALEENAADNVIPQAAVNALALEAAEVEIDNASGWFLVTINDAGQNAESVSVAVWSDKNGQDDLTWYTAEKQADGRYTVNTNLYNHGFDTGVYYFDSYAVSSDGSKSYIKTCTAEFKASSNGVKVENTSSGYSVSLGDITLPGGVQKVKYAVWSEVNGQDDLRWYDGKYDASSHSSSLTYSKNDFSSQGNFFVDVYGVNAIGKNVYLGGTTYTYTASPAEAKSVEVEIDNVSGWFLVTVDGVSSGSGISEVNVAVWSDKNGQDDLAWYAASKKDDGRYIVNTNIVKHNFETGLYYFDAYVKDTAGKSYYVGTGTAEFKASAGNISVEKTDSQYKITADSVVVPGGVKNVRYAVWSEENGQDDLKWFTGKYDSKTRASSLTYNVSEFVSQGKYFVDLYGTNALGKSVYLGGITYNTESPGNDTAKKEIYIEIDDAGGWFLILVNGMSQQYSVDQIKVRVWSDENGTDDETWYNAVKSGDSYRINTSLKEHDFIPGLYHFEVYAEETDGTRTLLGSDTAKFTLSSSDVTVKAVTDNSVYDASVSDLQTPGGASTVRFKAWSEANGEDDMVWYTASKAGNTYKASVDISKHAEDGRYIVEAYAVTPTGALVYLGKSSDIDVKPQTYSVAVSNADNKNGTFDVTVKVSSSWRKIGSISIPVWSKADQSDIYWYNAVNAGNNMYTAAVDIRNHDNNTGTFNVDVWGHFSDRTQKWLTGTAQAISAQTETGFVVSNADGSSSRRVTYINPQVSSAKFAVWTEENGQDDIVWYEGRSNGNGSFYCDVSASSHSGNGTYIVHVYSGDKFFADTSFDIIDYVEWAIRLSNDESVGYSQDYRCLNPDVDCSSFVYYALYNNGFAEKLGGYPFYTGSQVSYMQRCGFKVLDFTSEENLQPGDVLWYRNVSMGHTEIYIGNGLMVGAHDSVVNGVDYSEGGDQTGQEVSIRSFSNPGWMKVLRLG